MLVVKKPFKNFGTYHLAGSVITEPAKIKRLKGKIAEGKIIEVNEHNYNGVASYFKSKYGVTIPKLGESTKVSEEPDRVIEDKKVEPVKTTVSSTSKVSVKA